MRGFYSPLDWKEAGQWKFSYLCGDLANFIGQVSQHIDPYWDSLREPFTDLWQEVFDGITLHPTNEEDLHLFKPKCHDRKQLSDARKQRSDDRKQSSGDRRRHSGDRRRLSEGAGGCLKNDLPITHDIFLDYLDEMLEIAKDEDDDEEQQRRELQLATEQARLRAEQTKLDLEVAMQLALHAKRDLRSKTLALNSIGQTRDALPTDSSSTSAGLGITVDSLDSSATIVHPSQPWNPFTGIRGESLILENYDDGVPTEPVNNYFTPLSCIGVSQTAQFHIPSSDLPSANHAPLVTRAFPFSTISKKRANSEREGDFESANSRVSKRQKSVKSGKAKNASSSKRGSTKGKRLRSSFTLLGQLKFQQRFRIDSS
jgi:hypothetical protein